MLSTGGSDSLGLDRVPEANDDAPVLAGNDPLRSNVHEITKANHSNDLQQKQQQQHRSDSFTQRDTVGVHDPPAREKNEISTASSAAVAAPQSNAEVERFQAELEKQRKEAEELRAKLSAHAQAALSLRDDSTCEMCLELMVKPVAGACGHAFCSECLDGWTRKAGKGYVDMFLYFSIFSHDPACHCPLSAF